MSTKYVIDACALIDAVKNYNMSKSTFLPIWETIDELIVSGSLITSSEIKEELKDDELVEWVKQRKKFLIPLTKDIQEKVSEILKEYPTLIKMKSTSNSNGDPFLIATAIVENGCIVTNEKPGDEKSGDFRIPNVCNKIGVSWMDLRTFLDQIID